VGRNTEELLRVVTALEKTSEEHVMTPANWKAGDDILVPTVPKPEGSADELASEGYYKLAWFVWFKKAN
jgi:peroxiredoxin (alkyl hydroperoxide reductase subunit C)